MWSHPVLSATHYGNRTNADSRHTSARFLCRYSNELMCSKKISLNQTGVKNLPTPEITETASSRILKAPSSCLKSSNASNCTEGREARRFKN